MSGSRLRLGVATVSVLALLAAVSPAAAVPGGGGGGGDLAMPSGSTSRYDPAEEYQKGVEALQQGEFRDAERAFRHVTDAAPSFPDGHFLLGLARVGRDRLKPARRAFQAALRRDENHIAARAELGVTLAKLGEAEDAQEQLEILRSRADACAQTCEQAADLAAAVSKVEAAIGAGPQASLVPPSSSFRMVSAEAGDAAYVDAVALINEGRYADAIAALRATEAAFGPHPDVFTYIGFANRKLGRYEEAERYYLMALDAAPDHRGATEYLGEMRIEQGRLDEAARLLGRLDELCDFGCAEADELRRWIDEAVS